MAKKSKNEKRYEGVNAILYCDNYHGQLYRCNQTLSSIRKIQLNFGHSEHTHTYMGANTVHNNITAFVKIIKVWALSY